MKQTLFFLLGIIFLASCETIEKEIIEISPNAKGLTLKIEQVFNDSTISLRWGRYGVSNFRKYTLFREATVLQNGIFVKQRTELKSFDSPDSVTYTERDMPRALRVAYQLYVMTDHSNLPGSAVTYTRPDITNVGIFNDVLINTDKDYLYLCDMGSGTITIFNYTTNQTVRKVELKRQIGYCALGNYDGPQSELYVPDAHGWLYILDALTLETKEKIYVGGLQITSVVEVAGKLFVSSSDLTYAALNDNSLKIYDRATLKLVARTGYRHNSRLVHLKNPSNQVSGIELIDVSTVGMPANLAYYQFNPLGNLITKYEDSYHSDHPIAPSLVKAFPDGQRIITGGIGTVYTKDLRHEKDLVPSRTSKDQYLDYAFNSSGSVVYAALNNANKIAAIQYPTGNTTNTYATLLKPYRIFLDGNQLICLTKPENSWDPYFFIEKFNL